MHFYKAARPLSLWTRISLFLEKEKGLSPAKTIAILVRTDRERE